VKPAENFLTEMVEYVNKSITDSRMPSYYEKLEDNPNMHQEVAKFGLRIRPEEGVANSQTRVLEKVVSKRGEDKTTYEPLAKGTLKELLAKLQDPNLMEDMDDFVRRMNKQLFFD